MATDQSDVSLRAEPCLSPLSSSSSLPDPSGPNDLSLTSKNTSITNASSTACHLTIPSLRSDEVALMITPRWPPYASVLWELCQIELVFESSQGTDWSHSRRKHDGSLALSMKYSVCGSDVAHDLFAHKEQLLAVGIRRYLISARAPGMLSTMCQREPFC
jgi:hypothetical protein